MRVWVTFELDRLQPSVSKRLGDNLRESVTLNTEGVKVLEGATSPESGRNHTRQIEGVIYLKKSQ